jgi:hypothetical protein
MEEFGCSYCWDTRKKIEKPVLYFFDAANNYRECDYCPKCGRKYGEVPTDEQLESTTATK